MCKLYVKVDGDFIPAGTFKTRDAALDFFRLMRFNYIQKDGSFGKPVWVETGSRRRK